MYDAAIKRATRTDNSVGFRRHLASLMGHREMLRVPIRLAKPGLPFPFPERKIAYKL
jgi:hypothetical protein